MKKKLLVLAAAALSLTGAVSGTLAYFTDAGTAHNIITTGGVGIEIVEYSDGNKITGTMPESFNNVMPGTNVSKVVTVANTKDEAVWIRVKLETVIDKDGRRETTDDELSLTTTKDGTSVDVVQYMMVGENDTLVKMTDSTEWKGHWFAEGGYYYHTEPVAPVDEGGTTTELFEKVYFAPEMGNEYQNCTIFIDINAEAIQAKNNMPLDDDGNIVLPLTAGNLLDVWPEGVEILQADVDIEADNETDDEDGEPEETPGEGTFEGEQGDTVEPGVETEPAGDTN